MVERTRGLDLACHAILVLGGLLVCLPIYFAIVVASHTTADVLAVPAPWLPGDRLLENALVHTPPGTPVEVSVRGADVRAEITVTDGGPGISAEDRAELFERFYRGDSTKASGSGLGLAIAKELAELMGGRIELESKPGRTVFLLVLPADELTPKAEPEREPVTV